jgi:hypothetical protein
MVNELAFKVIQEMNGLGFAYESTFSDAFDYVVQKYGYDKNQANEVKLEVLSKVKMVLI